jgi:serine/threonine protein kinase
MTIENNCLEFIASETFIQHFTVSCGLDVARQCLEACEQLHGIGFVHRDIKPANFASGYGSLERKARFAII